jgi:hypothetical protein
MASGTPHFFLKKQFETLVFVAEVMTPADGRMMSLSDIAARADALLSNTRPLSGLGIRRALTLLEFILPIIILRPLPFSWLSLDSRRKLLERIIASHGQLRSRARILETITAFSYYTDVNVRRGVAYVECEQRPRYGGLVTTPYHYPPPRKNTEEHHWRCAQWVRCGWQCHSLATGQPRRASCTDRKGRLRRSSHFYTQ